MRFCTVRLIQLPAAGGPEVGDALDAGALLAGAEGFACAAGAGLLEGAGAVVGGFFSAAVFDFAAGGREGDFAAGAAAGRLAGVFAAGALAGCFGGAREALLGVVLVDIVTVARLTRSIIKLFHE